MIFGNSRRIVVVKGIPSNFIEEAILILKHEPDYDNNKPNIKGSTARNDSTKVNTEYILKEAETIINSYITENKLNEKYKKKVVFSKGFPRSDKKGINFILNAGLVLSIGILVVVLVRLI